MTQKIKNSNEGKEDSRVMVRPRMKQIFLFGLGVIMRGHKYLYLNQESWIKDINAIIMNGKKKESENKNPRKIA